MTIGRIPSVEGGIQPTIFDAKADLLTATAADTPARLAVGANGTLLTADSSEATGLKWAAPAGVAVKQIVTSQSTSTQTLSSTTFTDLTGASVTITPTSASSSIIIFLSCYPKIYRNTNDLIRLDAKLFRGATELEEWEGVARILAGTAANAYIDTGSNVGFNYVDSPNSTSALTYKFQVALNTTANSATMELNSGDGGTLSIIAMEI